MRYVVVMVAMVCFAFAKAQTYELGIFAGGSNIIGDVGSTQFVNPRGFTLGGVAKWNRSDRHSFRGSLIGTFLRADDGNSSDPSRQMRGLQVDNKMIEGSLGIEYTFWDYELYSGKPQFTPYLYFGVSVIHFSNTRLNSSGRSFTFDGWDTNFGIPISLGFKTNIAPHITLAGEIGARYTFTDNLDGSNPEDGGASQLKIGNLDNNDWFMFTGVTVSYTFGRKPCYCNF
ncbi:hypothetical protein BST97_09255 [Nonlabens spongiae]|uniref:DUF6089 domain-containing protein n=1 Tax=Nonlabens spongiae TaxID=331648 RepID=A0A1W6MKR6_9FLAO|nr:DUF6089 family protein [Nonlabens spongiae]ARN78167.1 hypothetical protein BST97_09255 [Nonlabens spongiae]